MSARLAAAVSAFAAAAVTAALLVLVVAPGASGGPAAKPKPKLKVSTAVATQEIGGQSTGVAKATCPKGTSVIGGGYDSNGLSASFLARSSKRAYSGEFGNAGGGPSDVTMQAICVKGAGVKVIDDGSALQNRAP